MNNLVSECVSHLPPRDHERVKLFRKPLQAFEAHSSNDLKVVFRASLARNNTATKEYDSLAENKFGIDAGRLKAKSSGSRCLPVQSQVMGIPQKLPSLREEVEMSLDR